MRRCAVLLAFLAMTSFANADIVISVEGDTETDEVLAYCSVTVTIGIYNNGSAPGDPVDFFVYLDFYYPSEGTYALSNPRLGPAAGDFPASFTGPYLGDDDYDEVEFSQAWAVGSDEIPGEMFLIDLHCEGIGDVIIEAYDWRTEELVDTLIIHQIPEPATIALLGLGGLLLRRKK